MDTFSIGVVMYEIAAREYPYKKERDAYKKGGGKGQNKKLIHEIAMGERRPQLQGRFCSRHGVGQKFIKRTLDRRPHVDAEKLALTPATLTPAHTHAHHSPETLHQIQTA